MKTVQTHTKNMRMGAFYVQTLKSSHDKFSSEKKARCITIVQYKTTCLKNKQKVYK